MKRSAMAGWSIVLLCMALCATSMSYISHPWPERFAKPTVLIFCKTNGYHHASIATGIVAIKKLGEENGFAVDTTADSRWFRKKILKRYAALIFLSPTGKVFGPKEEEALKDYIHHG
ncbi:MAG TPA: ThuA domain-containing protein, partial [Puia sp.]|nr:ThuA domain-containing protein [Puia sp.]